ncbi:hypothetical protein [Sphingomonas sp. LY160]|uniref:hypothetical protein n=1 Tax=Sphingomonas sp. LY160 TaxID=3095342 RepID=UPI002ADEB975|nr:hypothetical protein [Sphingomonas sp. LY160]MEA1072929.1 hypothetical protein [Sphingomonas sp. LY160]
MPVSSPLADLLADRRAGLNARVAMARSRQPNLDTAALSAFLRDPVDPLLGHVLRERPDGGAAFIDTVFDMALSLVEHGRAGNTPRSAIVLKLWREVAPALAPFVAINPRDSLGALTNAAINLAAVPGVRLDEWLDILARLGGEVRSVPDLRALVILAGWRAGAAHLRDAALGVAIKPALALQAVSAPPDASWDEIVATFRSSRWWRPDGSTPSEGHRVGSFTGLGGRFPVPPALFAFGNAFFARSGDQHFLLDADTYGATLRPVFAEALTDAQPACPAPVTPNRGVEVDGHPLECDLPANGLAMALTDDSIALASPWSYQLRVYPRRRP